jgi:hypothetical protein
VPTATTTARALGSELHLEVPPDSDALEEARAGAARFEPRELRSDDIRSAIELIAEHATINPYAEVRSRHPALARVKGLVRKATFFVAHDLAVQVTDLAHAVVVTTSATAERIESLEAENRDLRARLERLEGTGAGAPR